MIFSKAKAPVVPGWIWVYTPSGPIPFFILERDGDLVFRIGDGSQFGSVNRLTDQLWGDTMETPTVEIQE